ncbi:MAG TPA: methyltransferase domain-containing protein [Actinomycetota bacterium]|nr:methyltransferase domain-containing protein [Actinomycetota bacterium]
MDTWDPTRYHRFAAERAAPFHDLLSLVEPVPGGRVVDLGCGSGELTAQLHRRLEASETLGLDSSPAMLERAAELAGDGLRFAHGDIASFREDGWDVVFSNAALHWLPDQGALLERLVASLNPGGQLAVQMPANHDHPSHLVAAEVAGAEPFRTALGGYRRESPVRAPEWYAVLLDRLGLAPQHVRLQVYLHHLAARDEVVKWVQGTLLTDYQARMPEELFDEFLTAYRERLLPHLEDARPYPYPFKRLLFWGCRGGS